MRPSKEGDKPVTASTIVKALLAVEVVSLAIAVALTVTPSRTGGRGGFASIFMDEPSFLIQLVVNFAVTNALLSVLAAVFLIVVSRTNKSDARERR